MIQKTKDILKIIISIFIIFLLIRSCSKAYTQQDLEDYLQFWKFETENGSTAWGTNSAIPNLYNLYINNYDKFTQIYQYLTSEETAISCGALVTSSNRKFYILKGPTGNYSTGTTWNNVGIVRSLTSTIGTNGETWGSMATSGTNNFTQNQVFIFNSSASDNVINLALNNNNIASQKQWIYTLNRSNATLETTGSSLYVTGFDIRIGQDWNITDTTIRIYTIENEQKVYRTITHRFQSANAGNQYFINLLKDDLPSGTYTYGIDLLYRGKVWKTTDTTEYQRINKTSSGTNGGNTTSGETGGNINVDLTGVTNEITNVRNEIASGNQKIIQSLNEIESGNQERQTFWENAYNSLFTISGDYVENKLNEIKESFNISGDYEEEKAFIELITEQSGDFIISWEDFTPHFSIKGTQIENSKMIEKGEINFSKLERENEDLHNVMVWERTLLGFALGVLLIKNYWKTLLHTLGIGVQVYEDSKEEVGTITQTITIDKNGNKRRTETYKKGNTTIRKEK